MGMVAASVLPLKQYAEFGGRSTRTEVVGFYVLTMVVGLVAYLVSDWLELAAAKPWLDGAVAAIFFIPTLALFVRRLHDSGRSGRWLLVVSPAIVVVIWEVVVRPRPFTLHIALHVPWWAAVPAFLSVLALWALLFWPDDRGTNRYGPNPRCGPLGEPA